MIAESHCNNLPEEEIMHEHNFVVATLKLSKAEHLLVNEIPDQNTSEGHAVLGNSSQ